MGPGRPDLYIGANGTTGTGFKGYIDSLFIYADALTVQDLDFLRVSVPVASLPVAGSAGYALLLSGNQHMIVSDSSGFWGDVSQFTVAGWFKPMESISNTGIFSRSSVREMTLIYQGAPGRLANLSLSLRQDSNDTKVRFQLGYQQPLDLILPLHTCHIDTWCHLAVTWNGTVVIVYENGQPIGDKPWNGRIPATKTTFLIGARIGRDGIEQDYFSGEIDDLQLWFIALDANWIAESYRRTITDTEVGLAAYWQFNEGRGVVATSTVGVAVFGVLTAKYMEQHVDDTLFWSLSTAPIQDRVAACAFLPEIISLNGSDARVRTLEAIIVSTPLFGALYEVDPSVGAHDMLLLVEQGRALAANDRVSIGPSIVYYYSKEGNTSDIVRDSFSYHVVTSDGVRSMVEGIVDVYVTPTTRAPSIGMQDATITMLDVRVQDRDVAEDDGTLFMRIFANQTEAVNGSNAFLSLGSTQGLVFTEGSGSYESGFSFVSSTDHINEAMQELTVFTRTGNTGKASVVIEAHDQGFSGFLTAPLTAEYSFNLAYLLGNAPVIELVKPSSAPITGSAFVTVHGKNLAGKNLVCIFGSTIVANATMVSSSMLRCPIPAAEAPGLTSFAVQDSVGYESNKLWFRFTETIQILSIRPSMGYVRGGTRVTIYGSGFVSSATYTCLFDGTNYIIGQYMSPTSIQCMSPSRTSIGTVDLAISDNGLHYINGPAFSYIYEPMVAAIQPAFGSTRGGGRAVILMGSNFANTTDLVCSFGEQYSEAIFVNENRLLCVPPAQSSLTGPESRVAVSLNGADMGTITATYRYVPPIQVIGTIPSVGVTTGGTEIQILGSGFSPEGKNVLCRLGNAAPIEATVVSDTLVKCLSPPSDEGIVSIKVTNNGLDYSTDQIQFTYLASPNIVSITPTVVAGSAERLITVYGEGFVSGSLYCVFQIEPSTAQYTPAVTLTPVLAECMTPSLVDTKKTIMAQIGVTISTSESPHPDNMLDMIYYGETGVRSILPSSGPNSGGTLVAVSGHNFVESPHALCRFGTTKVQALIVNETLLTCVSPPLATEVETMRVPVEISLNGVDFFGESLGFQYYEGVDLDGLSPIMGTVSGNTRVVVSGSGFIAGDGLCCFFDGKRVKASFLSPSSIVCNTPPSATLGAVTVTVSLNGVDIGQRQLHYQYIPALTMSSLLPNRGPAGEETVVTVFGTGFHRSGILSCYMGGQEVGPATWISDMMAQCTLLAQAVGETTVLVTNNKVDMVDPLPFTFLPAFHIDDVWPDAVLNGGGTDVRIRGSGFQESPGLYCKFGEVSIAATFRDSTEIWCTTPALDYEGDIGLSVLYNGTHFTDGKATIHYYLTPSVSSISPSLGPSSGGYTVNVEGLGFINNTRTICRFTGVADTPALVIRPTLLQCQVPALPNSTVLKTTVEISFNGRDFTASNLPFVYERNVTVYAISPHRGPLSGDTAVNVMIGDPLKTQSVSCIFGEQQVMGRLINPHLVTCLSPPRGESAEVEFALLLGGNRVMTAFTFTYEPQPVVNSISPASVSDIGGTLVNISGMHFVDVPDTACRFGDVVVLPAVYYNATLLSCRAPARLSSWSRSVAVQVTTNGADYSQTTGMMTYQKPSVVTMVSPRTGPLGGSTVIAIDGSDFVDTPAVSCRFGDVRVPAIFQSSSRISCISPANEKAESVPLHFTLNGVDYIPTSYLFTYQAPLLITGMSPILGSEAGGTVVTISGSDFLVFRDALVCEFGSQSYRVPATWISSRQIACVTPIHPPGDVSVRVSNNGQQFVATPFNFTYHSLISVASVRPTTGTLLGGTLIFIVGTGFVNSSGLSCHFGSNNVVAADFISGVEVSCWTPTVDGVMDVPIYVSNNGIDLSSSGHTFSFVQELSVVGMSPRSGSVAGGTTVNLRGSGFSGGKALGCVFAGVEVPGMVISDELMVCNTPPKKALSGDVSVQVVVDNLLYDFPGLRFHYYGESTGKT